MREHEWSSRLMLNGNAVRLGTVAEVIDQVHGRRSCEIALLDSQEGYFCWEFEGEHADMSMAVNQVRGEKPDGSVWAQIAPYNLGDSELLRYLLPREFSTGLGLNSLSDRVRGLAYLTAERLGPRETYPLEDPQLIPVVGPRGEHAVSILHSGRDVWVPSSLAIEGVPRTRLRQVEARMSRFFPGCEWIVDEVPQANSVTLGLRTSKGTKFHRPIHTGFGLTQVLPIVVAALSANPGGLLLIENPEVHLHPAGQAAMGEFLAEVAAAHIQIVLETHSDHVLNGIRRAVKAGILLPEAAALHFFRPRSEREENSALQVQSPCIDRNGNIDTWPDGFFDQFDKDMNYFAGWC
jgi:predicted ATPase